MYAVRNHKIHSIEIVKISRRGTALWCKVDNFKKHKLIALHRIFNTYDEAQEFLSA